MYSFVNSPLLILHNKLFVFNIFKPGVKIGQREGLSEIDVEKISMVYSTECVKRNKEYLLKTCPSVVKADTKSANTTKREIQEYYADRIWPYGIVNYQLKDKTEFCK